MVERPRIELGQGPHRSLDIYSQTDTVQVPMGDMLVSVQGVYGLQYDPSGELAVSFGTRFVTHTDRPEQCLTHPVRAERAPILSGVLGMRVLHAYVTTFGSFGQPQVLPAIEAGINDFLGYPTDSPVSYNHNAREYAARTAGEHLDLSEQDLYGVDQAALHIVRHGLEVDLGPFTHLYPEELAQVPFVASLLKTS